MAVCPECEADIEIDEYDVDKGEIISCPECGIDLEVVGLSPAGARPGPPGGGRLGGMTALCGIIGRPRRPRRGTAEAEAPCSV